MLINGCQEGKETPRLTEVKCLKRGQWVVVFVKKGGAIGETGTLASDETCTCGNILRCSHREDWGPDDPTGKPEEAFLETI